MKIHFTKMQGTGNDFIVINTITQPAVLEAIAFSPVRSQVKLTAVPPTPNEAVLSTVKRVAPLVPQIAQMFGIVVTPGAHSPRPLRPTRPVRPKGKPAPVKAPQPTPAATEAPSTSE